MTTIKKIHLDNSKKRMLRALAQTESKKNFYDIAESDLVKVEKCAVCGLEHTALISEVFLHGLNFFSTAACRNCLYTFRPVSPGLGWFQKCWKKIATDKPEVFNPEVEEIRKKRYQNYCTLLEPYVKGKKVLDIGAANGNGAAEFVKKGYDVECLEPEDNKANYIKKIHRLPVYTDPLEKFMKTGRKYDLVLFAHCLEHLDDPKTTMAHINQSIAPEGILYLEIPKIWNYVTWSDAFYLTHKSNFTEENIIALATNNNFQILKKIYYRHSEQDPYDMGFVMQHKENSVTQTVSGDKIQHTLDDVYALYRRNIPLQSITEKQILRYTVPYIEHFYCTLKLENKEMTQPDPKTGFISFITHNT